MVFTPAMFADRSKVYEDFEATQEIDEMKFLGIKSSQKRLSLLVNKDSAVVKNMYSQTSFVGALFEHLVIRNEFLNEEFDDDVMVASGQNKQLNARSSAIVGGGGASKMIARTQSGASSPLMNRAPFLKDFKEDEVVEVNWANEPLPEGWTRYQDDEGNPYYGNDLTGETQWEHPYSVYMDGNFG